MGFVYKGFGKNRRRREINDIANILPQTKNRANQLVQKWDTTLNDQTKKNAFNEYYRAGTLKNLFIHCMVKHYPVEIMDKALKKKTPLNYELLKDTQDWKDMKEMLEERCTIRNAMIKAKVKKHISKLQKNGGLGLTKEDWEAIRNAILNTQRTTPELRNKLAAAIDSFEQQAPSEEENQS